MNNYLSEGTVSALTKLGLYQVAGGLIGFLLIGWTMINVINQIMQVIGFAILGVGYQYIAGFYLTIGIDLTDSLQPAFGAGISKLDINLNRHHERLEVNLNLIAFALIYWIDKN